MSTAKEHLDEAERILDETDALSSVPDARRKIAATYVVNACRDLLGRIEALETSRPKDAPAELAAPVVEGVSTADLIMDLVDEYGGARVRSYVAKMADGATQGRFVQITELVSRLHAAATEPRIDERHHHKVCDERDDTIKNNIALRAEAEGMRCELEHRRLDVEQARAERDAARAEVEKLRIEADRPETCDACAGTGEPISGKPCMCGGSGLLQDAARLLRVELVSARAEVAALRQKAAIAQAKADEREHIGRLLDAVHERISAGGHNADCFPKVVDGGKPRCLCGHDMLVDAYSAIPVPAPSTPPGGAAPPWPGCIRCNVSANGECPEHPRTASSGSTYVAGPPGDLVSVKALLGEEAQRAAVRAFLDSDDSFGSSRAVREALQAAIAAVRRPPAPSPEAARDACENCHGKRGGVAGNENIVNGRRLCDYCHADTMPSPGAPKSLEDLRP